MLTCADILLAWLREPRSIKWGCPRRLQARWWPTSPGAVKSLVWSSCWSVPILPSCGVSPSGCALRESSKEETAWSAVRRQAWRSAASVDHWRRSMLCSAVLIYHEEIKSTSWHCSELFTKIRLINLEETALCCAVIPSSLSGEHTLFQCALPVYVFYWKLTHCAKSPLACVCLGLWRYVWLVPILDAALFTWEVPGSFGVNLSPRNATLGQENQQTGNERGHLHICLKFTDWKRLSASVCLIIFLIASERLHTLPSFVALKIAECYQTIQSQSISKYFYSFSGHKKRWWW